MRGRTEAQQRQSRARALHVECSWTTASLLTALPIWAGAWEEDMRRAVAASVSRGNPVRDLFDRAKLLFGAAIVARSLPAPASAPHASMILHCAGSWTAKPAWCV